VRAGDTPVAAAQQIMWRALANAGGRGLSGHTGSITTVVFSPDNHWLATGSDDTTVRLWDLTDKNLIAATTVLSSTGQRVQFCLFSPDSRWLIVGSGDSDFGNPLSPSRDGMIQLWDLKALPLGNPVTLRDHNGLARAIAFSTDSHWLVSARNDNTAQLWNLTAPDIPTGSIVLRGHAGPITAVAISPDNHWLATGSEDTTTRLWNLTTPDIAAGSIVLRGHAGPITAVAISPDNHWLATGSEDTTTRLWNLVAADIATTSSVLAGHTAKIVNLVFSPNSHWLITTGGYGQNLTDKSARLWDLTTPDPSVNPRILPDQEGSITFVIVSSDNHWLITGNGDQNSYDIAEPIGRYSAINVWDLSASDPTANPISIEDPNAHSFPEGSGDKLPSINAISVSPDSRWLIMGTVDRNAVIWDLTGEQSVKYSLLRGQEEPISTIAVSPDQRWLVTGGDDTTARLWDLTDSNLDVSDPIAAPFLLHNRDGSMTSLAISLDNRWLVTGGGKSEVGDRQDTTAKLWRLNPQGSTTTPIILPGHTADIAAVAISADSHWVVTASADTTARLWDLTATNPATTAIVLHGHTEPLTALAISADSHWLVTASADTTARLWDLTATDPATTAIVLRGHTGPLKALAISSNGHWLVTGSIDTTAQLWDLTAANPAGAAIILRGHAEPIETLTISHNNRWLISTDTNPETFSSERTTRLWDLTATDPATSSAVFPQETGPIAISPDDRWFVDTGFEEKFGIHLRELTATGAITKPISSEFLPETMAFSADSHWLLTARTFADFGAPKNAVTLWDMTASNPNSEPIELPWFYGGSPVASAFSADNRWAIVAYKEGNTALWPLQLNQIIDLACQTAGRNMTSLEWRQYFPGQQYRKTCPNLPTGINVNP
jgi:WD40 repeat protein